VITSALKDKEVAHWPHDADSRHDNARAQGGDGRPVRCLRHASGRFGTLDEFFESSRVPARNSHQTCGILNVNGFFDPLLELFELAVRQRFVRPEHRDTIVIEPDPSR